MTKLIDEEVCGGRILSGGWIAGEAGTFAVTDKASGERLGEVGLASPAQVAAAAHTAREAQRAWAVSASAVRAEVFHKAANILEANLEACATWLMRETGGVRIKADFELGMAVGILRQSAAMLSEPQGLVLPGPQNRLSLARRLPHGVVGVIAPFNVPLVLAIRAVSPALATGNAVLLKPDPQTAVSGGVLIARIFELAGLPQGLLHLVTGGADVGEAMCVDPNIAMIAFTGSTQAGRRVGALCGQHLKKVSLELGGKNSLIILDDANLELAVSNAAFGAYMHQGQVCMATSRVLAHASIAQEVLDRLTEKANAIQVGDPMDGHIGLGPLINEAQLQRVHKIVQATAAAGATVNAGGTYERLFYRPTVLSGVQPGMPAYDEEIFGPVCSVIPFDDDDEAVRLANDSEYGLSAAIVSRSVQRALALGNRLNTGLLHINDQTINDEPWAPFGGRGASGNGGRIGGPANWEEFTQWQWLTIKDEAPLYPF
jgi:benzaldehyde dehydrogenase (NAD)